MATTMNCPNCGSQLPPGAISCARCGHQLATPTTPSASAPPPPPDEPAAVTVTPTSARSSQALANAGQSLSQLLADAAGRWGVDKRSPVFTAAAALFTLAFLIGTFALFNLLRAGSDEFDQKSDAAVMFNLALALALGFAALAVLSRLEGGIPAGEPASQDQRIFLAACGLIVVFTLLSLYKGLDESLDAASAWYRYALLFTFFAMGFAFLTRPTPATVGSLSSRIIGLVAVGVSVIFGVVGMIQGRSDDFSTFAMGVTLGDAAIVLAGLAFAWFLGMRKAMPSRSVLR